MAATKNGNQSKSVKPTLTTVIKFAVMVLRAIKSTTITGPQAGIIYEGRKPLGNTRNKL